MSQTSVSASARKNSYYIRLLQGCGIGAAVTLLLLVLFAFILLHVQATPIGLNLLTSAAGSFGSLSAGFVTARLYRKKGLICGLLCGVILFLALYLLGLLFGGVIFSLMLLIRAGLMLLCSCVGGIWGVNSALKRKY